MNWQFPRYRLGSWKRPEMFLHGSPCQSLAATYRNLHWRRRGQVNLHITTKVKWRWSGFTLHYVSEWLHLSCINPPWRLPPELGRLPCGRRPAWCRRPGWRTWGRRWWSPVCLLKPGEKKTWHQTKYELYSHYFISLSVPPSVCLFFLPSSPQRTCRLQTTAATSCRGWPAFCRWRATSPRCRATRKIPWSSPTPARRCQNPCCPGWRRQKEWG